MLKTTDEDYQYDLEVLRGDVQLIKDGEYMGDPQEQALDLETVGALLEERDDLLARAEKAEADANLQWERAAAFVEATGLSIHGDDGDPDGLEPHHVRKYMDALLARAEAAEERAERAEEKLEQVDMVANHMGLFCEMPFATEESPCPCFLCSVRRILSGEGSKGE